MSRPNPDPFEKVPKKIKDKKWKYLRRVSRDNKGQRQKWESRQPVAY